MTISLLFGAFGCAKPTPAPPTAPGPAPAPAGEKYGGVFKIVTRESGSKFGDPVNSMGPGTGGFFGALCIQKLLAPTVTPGVYEPVLATGWELAPDESHYIVHLREGVKFHDGTDFNAEAVKWNLDRVIEAARIATERKGPPGGPPPEGPPPGGPPPEGEEGPPPGPPPGGMVALSTLVSVEVVDDYTVRLNLSEWNNMVLFDMAVPPVCGMISPTAFETNGQDWAFTHPIGTGPFAMTEFKRNAYATYERFADYWEEGLPYLDSAEWVVITDPMTQIASMKAGEVDAIHTLDIQSAKELLEEGEFDIVTGPARYEHFFPNATDPDSIWYDKRMREAFEYAIDKEKICQTIGAGLIEPLYECVGGVPGDSGTVPRKYNPGKARQLLAEAGYPDGVKTKLYFNSATDRDPFVAIQAYLADVGIELELEALDPVAMMQFRMSGVPAGEMRAEMMPGGATLLGPSMDMYTATLFNPDIKRPEGSRQVMEDIMRAKDIDEQLALWEELDRMTYEELIFIPLWAVPGWSAYTKDFYDYQGFTAAGQDINITEAWFSR